MKKAPRRCPHCAAAHGRQHDDYEEWYYRESPFMWGPFCSTDCTAAWDGKAKTPDLAFIFGSMESADFLFWLLASGRIKEDHGPGLYRVDAIGEEIRVSTVALCRCGATMRIPHTATAVTCQACQQITQVDLANLQAAYGVVNA